MSSAPRLAGILAVAVLGVAVLGVEPAPAAVRIAPAAPQDRPAAEAGAGREHARRTPIEHVVYLMQENHTFDNYFGTYPGADGIPADACMPRDPTREGGGCIAPFHVGGQAVQDLGHTAGGFERQYRDGAMDGFVWAHGRFGIDGALAMGHYDDRDIPFYWNVADEYVLFDRFFSSSRGGSVSNHMYWMAAVPGNAQDRLPADGFDDVTIFDRLTEAGIDWKLYIQNYDPTITYRNTEGLEDRAIKARAPVLAYARFLDDPALNERIVDMSRYFEDLEAGTLPAVAYLVPSGASEHPPGSIRAGEALVRSLLIALGRSSAWGGSLFLWTYDDSGGWYDHVPPPQVDSHGYGFRVPALLVSPYARRGQVDSTTLDFTSMIRFITDNWGLQPLAARDAAASSFQGALDFESPPRAPVFLPGDRAAKAPAAQPNRAMVVLAYAASLAFALGLVWIAGRRPRQDEPRGAIG